VNCNDAKPLIHAYADGELGLESALEIERHLEQCADCLSHFDFARSFLDAVHAARPADEDDGALRVRVLSALTDQGMTI